MLNSNILIIQFTRHLKQGIERIAKEGNPYAIRLWQSHKSILTILLSRNLRFGEIDENINRILPQIYTPKSIARVDVNAELKRNTFHDILMYEKPIVICSLLDADLNPSIGFDLNPELLKRVQTCTHLLVHATFNEINTKISIRMFGSAGKRFEEMVETLHKSNVGLQLLVALYPTSQQVLDCVYTPEKITKFARTVVEYMNEQALPVDGIVLKYKYFLTIFLIKKTF